MDKAHLSHLIERGLPMRSIAEEMSVSVSTVRLWMRRYGLHTQRTQRLTDTRAAREGNRSPLRLECRSHGVTEFRWRGRAYRCVLCASDHVAKRRRRLKELLVAEAGGSCQLCGYDRYLGALQFHHFDPSSRSYGLGRDGVTRSLDEAPREAAKCVLLCANCHAEVEGAIVALPGELTLSAMVPGTADPG